MNRPGLMTTEMSDHQLCSTESDAFASKCIDEGEEMETVDLDTLEKEHLVECVRYGEEEVIRAMVESLGMEVTSSRLMVARDEHGNSALHMSAANGNDICVKMLCELAPSLMDAPNAQGNTPLHWACISGHLSVVVILLQMHASTAVENVNERTPICEAQLHGRSDIVEYFIQLLDGGEDHSINPSDD